MRIKKIDPIHTSEILKEEFVDELEITQYRLAKDINVPPRRIDKIIQVKRAITADTTLRFGRYFSISHQFWINLQSHYDLKVESDKLGPKLETDVKIYQAVNE